MEPIQSELEELEAAGHRVFLRDDRIIVMPYVHEIWQYLNSRKAEVLAALRGEELPADEPMHVSLKEGPPDHFTRVPHAVFRDLMFLLNGNSFKVLCFLVDQIYGFEQHRASGENTLSYEQIEHGITKQDGVVVTHGTGLAKQSIARALKDLEDRGYLSRTHRRRKDGRQGVSAIKLTLPWEDKPDSQNHTLEAELGPETTVPDSQNHTLAGSQNHTLARLAKCTLQQKKEISSKERSTSKERGASRARAADAPTPPLYQDSSIKPRSRIRSLVREFDATCYYCKRIGSADRDPDGRWWHLDHIVPRSKGGTGVRTNVALACTRCNLSKCDRPAARLIEKLATHSPTD